MIAALGVFGDQLVLQVQALSLAASCWVAAVALWLVVLYGGLAVLTVQPNKPTLVDGLNGAWLTSVVLVPVMAQRMVDLPAEIRSKYDLRSLKIVVP